MLKVLAAVLAVLSAVISITLYSTTIPAVQKQAADNAAAISANENYIKTVEEEINNINVENLRSFYAAAQTYYNVFDKDFGQITILAYNGAGSDCYIDFYTTANNKVNDLTFNLSIGDTLTVYYSINENDNTRFYTLVKTHDGEKTANKHFISSSVQINRIYTANGKCVVMY